MKNTKTKKQEKTITVLGSAVKTFSITMAIICLATAESLALSYYLYKIVGKGEILGSTISLAHWIFFLSLAAQFGAYRALYVEFKRLSARNDLLRRRLDRMMS